MERQAGQVVAGFVVEEIVGRGSGGSVYRARADDGSFVALKFARSDDEEAALRLDREAELLRRLDHPNLLTLRDQLVADDQRLLVTTFIDGQSLADQMKAGPLPVRRAIHIAQQLAAVIDYLHEENVVHRDLSPANILVGEDDHVTLIDLGISQAPDTVTLTAETTLAGTPRYLAPEVIRGLPAGPRADQYSVAAILHEMIAGDPWIPDADVMATVLHHQLSTDPEPLNEIDPYVPEPLADAVLRGLSKEPSDRFDSVQKLVSAAAGPNGAPVDHGRLSNNNIAKLAALAAIAVFVAGIAGWQMLDVGDDPAVASNTTEPLTSADATQAADATGWPDGTARSLPCNLLSQPDFNAGGLPTDHYPIPQQSERIVDHGGVGDSGVLLVGDAGLYSQYSEVIEVVPGTTYTFSGHLGRRGEVEDALLGIAWMNAGYSDAPFAALTEVQAEVPSDLSRISVTDVAPDGAAFALPWLFKDASPGVVLADELIFAPASCELPE